MTGVIIKNYTKVKKIAIGKFDTFHLGHLPLIDKLDITEDTILTINFNQKKIFYRDDIVKKNSYNVYSLNLSDIKNFNLSEFINKLYILFPKLEEIVVGYDFRCGKDRKYSASDLKKIFKGNVIIINEIKYENIAIHTETIVKMLKNGNINMANKLLGYNYYLKGYRVIGNGLGSKELVPTINLEVDLEVILKYGVYNSFCYINNTRYNAITFVGNRISVDKLFAIEIHLLDVNDFQYDIKDQIKVEFINYIRENKKFETLKNLKEQISRDIIDSRTFFKNLKNKE